MNSASFDLSISALVLGFRYFPVSRESSCHASRCELTIRSNFSGSHTFSLTASAKIGPVVYIRDFPSAGSLGSCD